MRAASFRCDEADMNYMKDGRAMKMRKIWTNGLLTLLCVVIGFIFIIQIKSVSNEKEEDNGQNKRLEVVQQELSEMNEKNEQLSLQISYYKEELNKIMDESSDNDELIKILNDRLKNAEIAAGLVNVHGSGLVITMRDSVENPLAIDTNAYVIHAEDIMQVINELRDSGAEAISINDERILATSEIRCSGATVSVNNTRYSAPYVIKAVGPAENMENALKLRGGVNELLSKWGIELFVEKRDSILIYGYSGIMDFKYASKVIAD